MIKDNCMSTTSKGPVAPICVCGVWCYMTFFARIKESKFTLHLVGWKKESKKEKYRISQSDFGVILSSRLFWWDNFN